MLYRDYLHREGEWLPNAEGGPEDYAAVRLLQDLNEVFHERFPDVLTCAE